LTLLWAELRALKQLPTRVEALEAQNEKLKQEYAELGKDMDILREEYEKSKQTNTEFVEDINNLQEKYDALEDRLADLQSENETFVDTYDGQLTELRQDMHHFEGVVGCIQEGHVTEESLQMIQSVAIQEMRRRLADG
jgi:chromosome segregation ATPase